MGFRKVLIMTALAAIIVSLPMVPAKMACAQNESGGNSDVSAKLNRILNNQKIIMDQIAAVKQELDIVKIRVTQQQ